jgi:hypothetical protein
LAPNTFQQFYVRMFPRVEGIRFDVSPYDACLLRGLSIGGWARPIDLLELIRNELAYMPYEFSRQRLLDWSTHMTGRFVGVKRDPGATSPWSNTWYRLTTAGESILSDGLPRLSHAPPLWLGGTNVYSTWCYDRDAGGGAFVERHDGG